MVFQGNNIENKICFVNKTFILFLQKKYIYYSGVMSVIVSVDAVSNGIKVAIGRR